MRAITTAVFRWATYGVLPPGALLAGLTAALTGPRPAILLAGAISQLCIVPLLRSPVRTLRTLRPPDRPSAGALGALRPAGAETRAEYRAVTGDARQSRAVSTRKLRSRHQLA
jgi:hypothetical protein